MSLPGGSGPSRSRVEDDQAFHRATPVEVPPSSCGDGNGQRHELTEGTEPTRPRYSLHPLADAVGVELPGLARILNVSGSTWQKYRDEGVTEKVADRAAVKCGFHPFMIWPEMADHNFDDFAKKCAADDCHETFVPHWKTPFQKWCSERCKRRIKNRERYQNDAEFRAKRAEQRRAYYEATKESTRRRQQEQYWADPEAARAKRRERYRRSKEQAA
jgi:hypothetical protein